LTWWGFLLFPYNTSLRLTTIASPDTSTSGETLPPHALRSAHHKNPERFLSLSYKTVAFQHNICRYCLLIPPKPV
jgi:hypothetical protein